MKPDSIKTSTQSPSQSPLEFAESSTTGRLDKQYKSSLDSSASDYSSSAEACCFARCLDWVGKQITGFFSWLCNLCSSKPTINRKNLTQEKTALQEEETEVLSAVTTPVPQKQSPSAIELAQKEFLEWWGKDNSLGKGEFPVYVKKIQEALEDPKLPTKELTVYKYPFNWGFSLYYGTVDGADIPIPASIGRILDWQAKHEKDQPRWWPIKDSNGSHFLPKITVQEEYTGTGSNNTGSFLAEQLVNARYDINKTGEACRLLKVLTPYAKKIHEALGSAMYKEIRTLFPDYPEIE